MTSARRVKARHDWRMPRAALKLVATGQAMERINARYPGLPHEWYILKGRKPIPVSWDRMMRWAREQNRSGRMTVDVAREKAGEYIVSTIFLGMNHAFFGGPPVLFETMAYKMVDTPEGPKSQFRDEQYRYCTWEEAKRGHDQLVRRLRMQLVKNTNNHGGKT